MKPSKLVNIHEAKTHLSRLIEEAVQGEPFIIAKAGKPVVKVTAIDAPPASSVQRTGFLRGQISVPADFDRMGSDEITSTFEGTFSGTE
jgi:prevent-host-death family protein